MRRRRSRRGGRIRRRPPPSWSRATILQSNHEFDRALADLDRAIAREPRNARALLVRSTVLTVQGKYAEARADCPKLYGLVPEFYVFACTAAIDSLTGKAAAAAATLERVLGLVPATDSVARAWGESLLKSRSCGDAIAARLPGGAGRGPRDFTRWARTATGCSTPTRGT
jgi:tetratricopeptide (TPR) repeat protein